MKKRSRRTLVEIRQIRDQAKAMVDKHGELTLSQLIGLYGSSLGVRDTPSDKNLVKKQLDRLAGSGEIDFLKVGRDLVAKTKSDSVEESQDPPSLAALRIYALQVEEFSKTLQSQVRTLGRMVRNVQSTQVEP